VLPNDLIVLRNEGEDQQGCGKDLGGVECWIDPNGRPTARDSVSGPFDLAP
jgi:hypothetical protein